MRTGGRGRRVKETSPFHHSYLGIELRIGPNGHRVFNFMTGLGGKNKIECKEKIKLKKKST